MTIPQAFADIALGFSGALGVGFVDGLVKWPGTPTMDAGGSISAPGTATEVACSVQVDSATEAMRQAEGFTEKDMRLLILAATFDGEMDATARVEVLAGPFAGTWLVASVDRDPAGIYWECRGRKS